MCRTLEVTPTSIIDLTAGSVLGRLTDYSAPPLSFAATAPRIDEATRQQLEVLWRTFWEIRQFKVPIQNESRPQIQDGDLMHGFRLTPSIPLLRSFLTSGIVSGEIELQHRGAIAEDGETHYCADFFVKTPASKGDGSLAHYLNWCWTTAEDPSSMLRNKVPEHNFVPTQRNDRVAFILSPSKDLFYAPVLRQSGTELVGNALLEKLSVRFPRVWDRHLAVPVGIPANGIRYIVLGGRIESAIKDAIVEMVQELTLPAKVLDFNGKDLGR